jgi:hypothetical protein
MESEGPAEKYRAGIDGDNPQDEPVGQSRYRSFVKDGVEHGGRRVTGKRQRAGGHFVEDDAERKEVGAGIHILAESLFGRHVGHGAHRGARAGEMRLHSGLRFSCTGWVGGIELGETEIENFGVAPARRENIGRLDVAVNDVLGMGGVRCARSMVARFGR